MERVNWDGGLREVTSPSMLQPGDVIGIAEDDLPAAVVYRVTAVAEVRDGWIVDAVAWNTRERMSMRAWTDDRVAVYR